MLHLFRLVHTKCRVEILPEYSWCRSNPGGRETKETSEALRGRTERGPSPAAVSANVWRSRGRERRDSWPTGSPRSATCRSIRPGSMTRAWCPSFACRPHSEASTTAAFRWRARRGRFRSRTCRRRKSGGGYGCNRPASKTPCPENR